MPVIHAPSGPGVDENGYKILMVGEKGVDGYVKEMKGFLDKSFSELTKQVRELRHRSHFEQEERRKLEKGSQEKLRDIKDSKDILEPPGEQRYKRDRLRQRYGRRRVED